MRPASRWLPRAGDHGDSEAASGPYDVRDHGFPLTTEVSRMIIRSIVPDHVASLITGAPG
jgi:hypothetical protein